jgi:ribosomal protein S18 acetylase RimI-like enzyme
MVLNMPASFGVEFEFDYIDNRSVRSVYRGEIPSYVAPNWGYQEDYTASSELRSPVFTSLQQYVNECNRQFGDWIRQNPSSIPYMCNGEGRSLGQHMHLGIPSRRLNYDEKRKIAALIIDFYPFLAAIHAQPIPSHRGLTTVYARSMKYYRNFIDSDHYAEISDSHVGTVELRLFDSNIPQASLTCAWITTKLVEKALSSDVDDDDNSYDFDAYDEIRNKALRYGLTGLNVTRYLKMLKENLGNMEIPDIPCVKEIMYLVARYRLNPYGVWRYADVKPYEYMKSQLSDCSKFLENIVGIRNVRHEDKLRNWVNDANQLENLDQLIGLSMATDQSLMASIQTTSRTIQATRVSYSEELRRRGIEVLSREMVREAIENSRFSICRINELRTMDRERVARVISYLSIRHGEACISELTENQVIDSEDRFYVFVAYSEDGGIEQICGSIAIHVATGKITFLAVNRRFRRLGIARRLVEHVINVARERGRDRVTVNVRENNEPSLQLFRSLGFTETGRERYSIVLERRL